MSSCCVYCGANNVALRSVGRTPDWYSVFACVDAAACEARAVADGGVNVPLNIALGPMPHCAVLEAVSMLAAVNGVEYGRGQG